MKNIIATVEFMPRYSEERKGSAIGTLINFDGKNLFRNNVSCDAGAHIFQCDGYLSGKIGVLHNQKEKMRSQNQ
jgi:hypothetical protein